MTIDFTLWFLSVSGFLMSDGATIWTREAAETADDLEIWHSCFSYTASLPRSVSGELGGL
jgi:hypothetical protein